MRPKERIIPFLEFIDNVKLIRDIWNIIVDEEEFRDTLWLIRSHQDQIKEFWLENPDLRYSQVLINLGIIPNISGFWYYIEEDEILEQLGIPAREYLLWGRNYDKDMNLLPKTERILIKDMATDHIQAILDGNFAKNPKYIECFKNELKLRENEKTNL